METQIGKLTASLREKTGKGNNRKLRAAGQIPAVIYGGKGESRMLSLDPTMLDKCLDPVKRGNTLIELTITGGSGEQKETVLLKDYQVDALSQQLTHVDLIRIKADETLHLNVPLRLAGRPVGVQLGGKLNQVFRKLPVECIASNIPSEIVAEVSHLETGDTFSVGELKLDQGISVSLPASQTIALVIQPKGAAEEGAAAEGEGEADAEAAPAAEGEKAAE